MAKEPTRNRVDPALIDTTPVRRPSYIKVRAQAARPMKAARYDAQQSASPSAVTAQIWESAGERDSNIPDFRRCLHTALWFCDIKHGKLNR